MPITEYCFIKIIASIGEKLYSSIISFEEMASVISHLSNRMYSICNEIRSSQLDSAFESIKNAKNLEHSINKIEELNKAIVHLEDAYYLSKKLLTHVYTSKSSFLIFFTVSKKNYAVPTEHREKWFNDQIKICSILTLIYRYKGINELESKWFNEALILYKNYVNEYLHLSVYELERINQDYVYHEKRIEWEKVEYNEFFSKAEQHEIDEIHISSLGVEYQNSHLLKLISDFETGLKNARLE